MTPKNCLTSSSPRATTKVPTAWNIPWSSLMSPWKPHSRGVLRTCYTTVSGSRATDWNSNSAPSTQGTSRPAGVKHNRPFGTVCRSKTRACTLSPLIRSHGPCLSTITTVIVLLYHSSLSSWLTAYREVSLLHQHVQAQFFIRCAFTGVSALPVNSNASTFSMANLSNP